ncbi:MAG: helix-turn-helix domain-containing protein [Patescibacteria group bacterium]|jgi:excisionase family DNA binding protein
MKTDLITNNLINVQLMKPREAADFLAISRATLYRLVDRREIFAHKVGGSLRITKEDLDDYLNKIRIKPIDC